MLDLLLTQANGFEWGSTTFGFKWVGSHPALYIFNYPIYVYALCIVTGMCLAILIGAHYFKKRGYDPYDITIYALAIIPIGVLGARAYIFIFPWADNVVSWSEYFNFRSGGLGIYGGVIAGYIAGFVVCKIKKQDFRIVVDAVMPGLFLAQSLGRWGNFANMEAYGNLITTDYNALPNFLEFLGNGSDHGFNMYAVWISNGSSGAGWYQATFFYESVCTLIGFLVCVLVLTRSKRYKLGWCSAFYGIYYGIVRLVIEGMRSDSLYLYVGSYMTDIKISQLVSVCTITFGLWTLSKIYRKQLSELYRRLFRSEQAMLQKSRYVVGGVALVALAVGVLMLCLGGASKVLIGVVLLLVAAYCGLGVWAICDRLRLYCSCGKRSVAAGKPLVSDYQARATEVVVYMSLFALCFAFGIFSLTYWGIACDISNGVVLAVVLFVLGAAVGYFKLVPSYKALVKLAPQALELQISCDCGRSYSVRMNSFLLFMFPPVTYRDYGIEGLKPWVDPEKAATKTAEA